MKFVICFLIACVISVSTTLLFNLSDIAAFIVGMVLGHGAILIAQIWQYKSEGL